jgi:catechol 2,3-dioxygenase-like lactoylglutathione lyase family enzyme
MEKSEKSSSTGSTAAPSEFSGVFETALYLNDLAAAERFYGEVLGLKKIFSVPGRQLVYRCQESILLLFNAQHTEKEANKMIPTIGSEKSEPNGLGTFNLADDPGRCRMLDASNGAPFCDTFGHANLHRT